VSGTREAVTVARKHLIARNPRDAEDRKSRGEKVEEPLEIDYEVVPYSPTENSKTAQAKKLTQFMEILMNNQNIDQRRLTAHILDLLDISEDVMVSDQEIQAMEQQQMLASQQDQQAQVQAEQEAGGGPGDTIATGGMPEGVSEVPVGAMGAMAGGAGSPTPGPKGFS